MTNQLLAELEILQQAKDKLQNDYQNAVDKINELQQENKQLKEELEKKNKMYWQQQCAYYSSILYSLEEWLNLEIAIHNEDDTIDTLYSCVLDKIQELKDKYK